MFRIYLHIYSVCGVLRYTTFDLVCRLVLFTFVDLWVIKKSPIGTYYYRSYGSMSEKSYLNKDGNSRNDRRFGFVGFSYILNMYLIYRYILLIIF